VLDVRGCLVFLQLEYQRGNWLAWHLVKSFGQAFDVYLISFGISGESSDFDDNLHNSLITICKKVKNKMMKMLVRDILIVTSVLYVIIVERSIYFFDLLPNCLG
jgi:hypothetical protein